MVEGDIDAIRKNFALWATTIGTVESIAFLSPSREEVAIVSLLFPKATRHEFSFSSWDINKPCPSQTQYDLVVASNTFMCSPNPRLWFDHIFAIGKNLWVQDLIRSRRTREAECSFETGDVMRYSFLPEHQARVPFAYDLSSVPELHEKYVYSGNIGVGSDGVSYDSLKFVAWFKRLPQVEKPAVKPTFAPKKKNP